MTFYNISHLTGKIVFNEKYFGLLVFTNETGWVTGFAFVTGLALTSLTLSFLFPGLTLPTHGALDNSPDSLQFYLGSMWCGLHAYWGSDRLLSTSTPFTWLASTQHGHHRATLLISVFKSPTQFYTTTVSPGLSNQESIAGILSEWAERPAELPRIGTDLGWKQGKRRRSLCRGFTGALTHHRHNRKSIAMCEVDTSTK